MNSSVKLLKVLVCNDDGRDSPLLIPLVRALQNAPWCGEVRVVVPECERSWTGSAVTRREAIRVRPFPEAGSAAFSVTGTPADCALLGVFNLFSGPPDVVVSGINLGENTGVCYFMCSGTVGAAMTAFFSGISAVALSIQVPPEVRSLWLSNDIRALASRVGDWERVARTSVSLVADLLEGEGPAESGLYSVNMPWEVNEDSERVTVDMAKTRFNRVFIAGDDGSYEHDMDPISVAESSDSGTVISDCDAVSSGKIAVCPVTRIRL